MTSRIPKWQDARLLQAQETQIHSQHTGRSYRIQTACIGTLPPQGCPVLYILDGDAFFPAALSMAQSLLVNPMTRSNAPCLLVGIGYPNGAIRDLQRRALDYTPPLPAGATEADCRRYGQADRFGAFIDGELMPLLADRFPINTAEQALFGHSFGALFGAYSLLVSTKRFRRYFLISPSMWWHNRRLLDFMPSEIPQECYAEIRVGGLEQPACNGTRHQRERNMVTQAEDFAAKLRGKGVETVFENYPNDNHGSVPFRALPDCLAALAKVWQAV